MIWKESKAKADKGVMLKMPPTLCSHGAPLLINFLSTLSTSLKSQLSPCPSIQASPPMAWVEGRGDDWHFRLPFHSQDRSILKFTLCLTRNITSHFCSLLRPKTIILLYHFWLHHLYISPKLGYILFLNLGMKGYSIQTLLHGTQSASYTGDTVVGGPLPDPPSPPYPPSNCISCCWSIVTISGPYGPTNTPEEQNGFSFNQAWFEHGLNRPQQQRPPSPSH